MTNIANILCFRLIIFQANYLKVYIGFYLLYVIKEKAVFFVEFRYIFCDILYLCAVSETNVGNMAVCVMFLYVNVINHTGSLHSGV